MTLLLAVPPPFMWACPPCTTLLVDLANAFEQTEQDPYDDSAFRVQLTLAHHLATAHHDALPAPHTDGCKQCDWYEQLGDRSVLWAEHLARDLFLPEDVARLI